MPARPFLKWAGGKSQLLPELISRLPPSFQHYHEPFVGGGALFFSLWNSGRLTAGATLSDLNVELIDCYRAVRDHAEELIAALLAHKPYANDRDYFYAMRAWDRAPNFMDRPLVERAARTIFLNRTCYNGLYRLNNRRQFNAPFGYYKNPLIVDPEQLQEASRALQQVVLRVGDFSELLTHALPGDFIYFDPPYVPVSATASFTAYTPVGFTEAEQRRLAELFFQLRERGCYLMLSNSYTALARELYAGLPIHEPILARRKINCDGTKRGGVEELIVCSYGR